MADTVRTFDMNARVRINLPAWLAELTVTALERMDTDGEDSLIEDGRNWAISSIRAAVNVSGAYQEVSIADLISGTADDTDLE